MSRISLLVSRDLAVMVQAARSLPGEVTKQLRAHTRRVVEPAFQEEMRDRVANKLETRVLLDTARVSVFRHERHPQVRDHRQGARHPLLRFWPVLLSSGLTLIARCPRDRGRAPGTTAVSDLCSGAPRRKGYVFHPAVQQAFIPRAAALWFQTTYRTVAETFEKAGR